MVARTAIASEQPPPMQTDFTSRYLTLPHPVVFLSVIFPTNANALRQAASVTIEHPRLVHVDPEAFQTTPPVAFWLIIGPHEFRASSAVTG